MGAVLVERDHKKKLLVMNDRINVWVVDGVHKGQCGSLIKLPTGQMSLSSPVGVSPVSPRPISVVSFQDGHEFYIPGSVVDCWSTRRPEYVDSSAGPDCSAIAVRHLIESSALCARQCTASEGLRLLATVNSVSSALLREGGSLDGCIGTNGVPLIVTLALMNPALIPLAVQNTLDLDCIAPGFGPPSPLVNAVQSHVDAGRPEAVSGLIEAGVVLDGKNLIALCIRRDVDLGSGSEAVVDLVMATGYLLTLQDLEAMYQNPRSASAAAASVWACRAHERCHQWNTLARGRLPLSDAQLSDLDEICVQASRHRAVQQLRRVRHVKRVEARRLCPPYALEFVGT